MGIPKRDDPYGPRRFEVGHPGHTARTRMESHWPKPLPPTSYFPNVHSPRVVQDPRARTGSRQPGISVKTVFLIAIVLFILWLYGHRP